MNNPYDITKHIDYANHMKNYITKADAKRIVDELRNRLTNRPIQSHPDYPAIVRLLSEKHQKELSKLEQEMRKKTTTLPNVEQSPEYKKMVAYYEKQIKDLSKEKQTKSAYSPPAPKCPKCPRQLACPASVCPDCPNCEHSDYAVTSVSRRGIEPSAFNNFQLSYENGYANTGKKPTTFGSAWLLG